MLKDTKCCPGGLCYALVGANECASFDVTNILQLVPPFLQTYCTNAANIPRERRHEWWIVKEDIWYYLAPLVSESDPSPHDYNYGRGYGPALQTGCIGCAIKVI